ncbi:MAG: hypothetical protein M1836_003633 [Candelina mexicana]|nr:MAG: hypothetical protein M1836_003633 [Candelina mexicana]
MESSYIPLFMRSTGLFGSGGRTRIQSAVQSRKRDPAQTRSLIRGARVSVLGLVVGNFGSIVALLIGLIITHVRGQGALNGYRNFLLAITIAGCLTIVFGAIGGFFIPSVKGKTRPPTNLLFLSARRFVSLLKSIRKYPEAFKLCIGWILWNTAYSNFNSVMALLFRETLGLGSGDKEYTVWTFTALIFACCGSISWMFAFPYIKINIKTWAYTFLTINLLCLLWGCIGISKHVTIGYKHRPEFYIEQFLFLSTSSALRSLNRVLYASMLPVGREAQFFGLEITLDLATGWINPLVQGTIQNRTHNLRFPMIPNLLLMLLALCFYIWTKVEKGMEDAKIGDGDDDEVRK